MKWLTFDIQHATAFDIMCQKFLRTKINDKRNDGIPYDRWPRKRGHTGSELLVVILLVTILSVAMLPVLKPLVIQAQYEAEAVPAVGTLRTRIGLFHFESDHLPGLGLPSESVPGGSSQLAPGLSKVQTVAGTNAAFSADFNRKEEVVSTNHVFYQVDCSYRDLTGRRLRMEHFQYRVDACETNRYVYAVGAFGNSTPESGLPSGTGYAVLEWQTGKDGESKVAVWKRWKSVANPPRQVILVNADEAKVFFNCGSVEQALSMHLCWIGDPEALLSADAAVREQAKAALRKAGWEMTGEPSVPWYRKWHQAPLAMPTVAWYRKWGEVLLAMPLLLLYFLVLTGLAMGTFAERRFHWRCGAWLAIWFGILVVLLPKSSIAPLIFVYCGGMLFVIGLWIWDLCAKGLGWVGRRFRRKEGG